VAGASILVSAILKGGKWRDFRLTDVAGRVVKDILA